MDYCSFYFGKSLINLEFEDVTVFFGIERIESDVLEFKSFSGNLQDENYFAIIRSICAFLNSKGGVLIWGAPKGVKLEGKKEHIYKGELSLINTVLNKDQLISKITDSIIPLPNKIKVKIIPNNEGNCICIFEVDESDYSPHQFKGTYYMRIDGQTKPAPHHYIEALFRKIKFPILEGFIKIKNVIVSRSANNIQIKFETYFFNWSEILNVYELSFRILIDSGQFVAQHTNELRKVSVHPVLHFGQPYHTIANILIDRDILAERNHQLFITLMFGGKNTPSKISEYELGLAMAQNTVDGEKYVIKRRENILHKDHHNSMGITREKNLEDILGRKVGPEAI